MHKKTDLFTRIPVKKVLKSRFDLSHQVKLSAKLGFLVPTLTQFCMPGDRFRIGTDSVTRFAPMIAPAFQRYDVYHHTFFCPMRILWPKWDQWTMGPSNIDPDTGLPITIPSPPTVDIDNSNWSESGLVDYMGFPDPDDQSDPTHVETVSAFPFAAYQKIYDEYYRDQNLQPRVSQPLADGDNTVLYPNLTEIRRRAWEHDYFTACLPFAQKGVAVNLPIGGFNDVQVYRDAAGGPTSLQAAIGTDVTVIHQATGDLAGELYADTSSLDVTSTTINDFRRAERLQMWLEKNARGGTRINELIFNHFNERPPDARLQRPEYITGTATPVSISEVLQTAPPSDMALTPQGNMAGHGIAVSNGRNGFYKVQEFGYIISIMSIRPKTAYMQGIEKHWLINDPLDLPWPDFANIGEQAVLNKEIYAFQGVTGEDTFGYIPRYAEHKFKNDRVSGDFRNSLNYWHDARTFGVPPALNADFIECAPSNRPFAVTDEDIDKVYCYIQHNISAIRPLPKYGVPHL